MRFILSIRSLIVRTGIAGHFGGFVRPNWLWSIDQDCPAGAASL